MIPSIWVRFQLWLGDYRFFFNRQEVRRQAGGGGRVAGNVTIPHIFFSVERVLDNGFTVHPAEGEFDEQPNQVSFVHGILKVYRAGVELRNWTRIPLETSVRRGS